MQEKDLYEYEYEYRNHRIKKLSAFLFDLLTINSPDFALNTSFKQFLHILS